MFLIYLSKCSYYCMSNYEFDSSSRSVINTGLNVAVYVTQTRCVCFIVCFEKPLHLSDKVLKNRNL